MPKLKSAELLEQLQAKRAEAKTLLDKENKTEDEVKTLKGLIEAIKTDQVEVDEKVVEEQFEAANNEALKSVAAPQRPKFLGTTPAGDSYIKKVDEQKGRPIYELAAETGYLGLSNEQLTAISSPEYKTAFRDYLRGGMSILNSQAIKVMNEGSDPAGGFLVPEEYLNRLIEKMATPTGLASFVSKLTTSRDALNIPKVVYDTDDIYTTGMRITWTGEIPSSGTIHRVTEPVFGMIRIPVHTAMMSLPMTNDMLEDAAFPVLSWATGKFLETVELLYDNMILNGSGVGQPTGILKAPGTVDNPPVSIIGAATAVTADGLVGITYDVPPQYDGNSRFVMNKTSTGKAVALLKDTSNRYLFSAGTVNADGIAMARPTTLVGYPVTFSQFMPNATATTYPVIFGDLTGYTLLQRIGFSIQVLRERYAEENQVVLLGRIRFGGLTTEPWKMRIGDMT
jgi:HK97 family phage major capsid protein